MFILLRWEADPVNKYVTEMHCVTRQTRSRCVTSRFVDKSVVIALNVFVPNMVKTRRPLGNTPSGWLGDDSKLRIMQCTVLRISADSWESHRAEQKKVSRRPHASVLERAVFAVRVVVSWGEVIASHVTATVTWINTKLFCDQTPNYFVIKHQNILWSNTKLFCDQTPNYFVIKHQNILWSNTKLFCDQTPKYFLIKHRIISWWNAKFFRDKHRHILRLNNELLCD